MVKMKVLGFRLDGFVLFGVLVWRTGREEKEIDRCLQGIYSIFQHLRMKVSTLRLLSSEPTMCTGCSG